MYVQMVIQMFPSNKINLTVGATALRQLPGAQSPTRLPEILPCMLPQSREGLIFLGPAAVSLLLQIKAAPTCFT